MPWPLTPSPPPLYPIWVRSHMPVPVMGISTFPIEMIACEDETEEKSTLFTSDVDLETGGEGLFKPLFHFNSSKASSAACN